MFQFIRLIIIPLPQSFLLSFILYLPEILWLTRVFPGEYMSYHKLLSSTQWSKAGEHFISVRSLDAFWQHLTSSGRHSQQKQELLCHLWLVIHCSANLRTFIVGPVFICPSLFMTVVVWPAPGSIVISTGLNNFTCVPSSVMWSTNIECSFNSLKKRKWN